MGKDLSKYDPPSVMIGSKAKCPLYKKPIVHYFNTNLDPCDQDKSVLLAS